jgi:hypothetical protein
MLPKIKNQHMIKCFVNEKYIDHMFYEYNQIKNKKLVNIYAQSDVIDVCGIDINGCVNEIINMEEIRRNLKLQPKEYRFLKNYIVSWDDQIDQLKRLNLIKIPFHIIDKEVI